MNANIVPILPHPGRPTCHNREKLSLSLWMPETLLFILALADGGEKWHVSHQNSVRNPWWRPRPSHSRDLGMVWGEHGAWSPWSNLAGLACKGTLAVFLGLQGSPRGLCLLYLPATAIGEGVRVAGAHGVHHKSARPHWQSWASQNMEHIFFTIIIWWITFFFSWLWLFLFCVRVFKAKLLPLSKLFSAPTVIYVLRTTQMSFMSATFP